MDNFACNKKGTKSESFLNKALAGYKPDNPRSLSIMGDLALLYTEAGKYEKAELLFKKVLTCNRLSRIGSVLFPDCFAAFTNCFWDAYRFIGHILNRQSRNFFGGFTGSPASGHTTLLSSTRLETK
mgnify:CR=1 FL=1